MKYIEAHVLVLALGIIRTKPFAIPSGVEGKTDPDQKPCEGWGITEETKRAKALWLELLEVPPQKRFETWLHGLLM